MSNQIYNYSSGFGVGGPSSLYSLRSSASGGGNPYFSDGAPSRRADPFARAGDPFARASDPFAGADASMYSPVNFGGSSLYSKPAADPLRLSGGEIAGIGAGAGGLSAGKIGGGIAGAASLASPSLFSSPMFDTVGMKRPSEALYHQTILGSHNTFGQSEALFSSSSLVKRPRHEYASNLPIYPQRPGQKDCAHYMLTRTCKFGDACKFDHPIWVPEGGIPDWKEVPLVPTSESLPERPGEPDCPYYVKTQKCKFGSRCKFNHPKDKLNASAGEGAEVAQTTDSSILPERPSEPICSFYVRTGKCKFGASCKFHHPKDLQIPSTGQDTGGKAQAESVVKDESTAGVISKPSNTNAPFSPALMHNSKGLPIRPGETDCPFYLKTGSCKFGATCRYNHPDRSTINPTLLSALGQTIMPSQVANLPVGVLNPAASLLPNIDPRLAQTSFGISCTVYPQRPGEIECDFYMKTGLCKFGERCKFDHPIDRSASTPAAKQALQQNVKLTLAGLPRREGAVVCSFYMKTGTCKYGSTCKFDHPPPGEAVAMAAVQGTGAGTASGADAAVTTTEGLQKDAAGFAEEQQ